MPGIGIADFPPEWDSVPSATLSRQVAFDVTLAVERDGAYANLSLPIALARSSLEEKDRGFVTQLVYGSLRAQGELDAVISQATRRDCSSLDPEVRTVLRLGVYQLIRMRVDSHAAVDESVKLTRNRGLHRVTGLVNAALRAVAAHPVDYWNAVIGQSAASLHSHPSWIAAKIELALAESGGEGELHEALDAHNEAPLVTLCHLPGLSLPGNLPHTPYSPVGSRLPGGDPQLHPGVSEGAVRVQDEGSQLVTLALSRWEPLSAQDAVWDMCAGPGGKTALLSAEACAVGANVLATEISAHRAQLVENSTRAVSERFPGLIEVDVCDATQARPERFSRILLDAPCSGLGALRRRPEARWRKSAGDIPGLVDLQTSLLRNGLESLVVGGVLAYVTCSPVVEETTSVVSSVLTDDSRFTLLDSGDVLEAVVRRPLEGHRRGNAVQLWTHRHGTDAMFLQLITRVH